jgi:hypothetical protein
VAPQSIDAPVAQAKPVATVSPPGRPVPVAVTTMTSPSEIRRQAITFAQRFGATSVPLDQLARWTQPVCVTVQGLPADAAGLVRGRVEEVADDLGVRKLPAGCDANIQIMFTDQPQALLDRVAAEHERLLGYWHRRDRDRLKTVTHPIQAWYVTGTGGGGGNVVGLTFAATGGRAGAAPTPTHGFQIDDEDNAGFGPTGCGDKPHFTACLTSEFQNVLVVVDAGKVQDLSPGLIADYVALLAMAQPKSLDSCSQLPSAIELFAKGCAGRAGRSGLTQADAAYLTALYKIDLQARKAAQQGDIAARMADMLIKSEVRLAAQRSATETARR